MTNIAKILSCFGLLFVTLAKAQITVTVSQPNVIGQKVIVQLDITNELTNEVKSARAICLLMDEQGKLVGQSTKWVIGQNKTHLDPKDESKFNFVITTLQSPVTSNLTAKVIFSRVILDNGKLTNPQQVVAITPAPAK